MEVSEASSELEEYKLVELKKFSRREIIIKRGIDILGGISGFRFISYCGWITLSTLQNELRKRSRTNVL